VKRISFLLIGFLVIGVLLSIPFNNSTDRNWNRDQTLSRARQILYALAGYHMDKHRFPKGTYDQIIDSLALSEDGISYLDYPHPKTYDSWGRPFHIDFRSPSKLEVRSSAADGVLYTRDDLIVTLNTEQGAAANP
jgi:hypothetical protein